MRRSSVLLVLGFLSLVAGVIVFLGIPYNIFKSTLLAFFLVTLGTFLIIIEVIMYHWALDESD